MGSRAVLRGLLIVTLVMLVGCGGGGQNSSTSVPPPTSPTLNSITVTPSNAQIAKGTTQQFTATGKYSDGSSKNLTDSVTWGSSAVAVAGVNTSGVAWATQPGSATITAKIGRASCRERV